MVRAGLIAIALAMFPYPGAEVRSPLLPCGTQDAAPDFELRLSLESHPTPPTRARLSRDGRLLITAGADGVRVWNPGTGVCTASFAGPTHFDLDPDADAVWVLDAKSNRHLFKLKLPDLKPLSDLRTEVPLGAFRLLSATRMTAGPPLWEVIELERGRVVPEFLKEGLAGMTSFEPVGRNRILVRMPDGVRLYDVLNKRETRKFVVPDTTALAEWDPTGKHVIVACGSIIRAYDVESARESFARRDSMADITHLAVSPNGRWCAAACTDQAVRIYDIGKRSLAATVQMGLSKPTTLLFSGDSRLLMTFTNNGEARYWDPAKGTPAGDLGTPHGFGCVLWTEAGQLAVCDAQGSVRLLNAETGKQERRIKTQDLPLSALAISKDGARIATLSMKGTLSISEGEKEIVRAEGLADRCAGLFYAPDGALWASAGDRARRWAVPGGATRDIENGGRAILAMALSPDGSRLVVVDPTKVTTFDAATGVPLKRTDLATPAQAGQIAFLADGKRFVLRVADDRLAVRGIDDHVETGHFQSKTLPLDGPVALHPNGKWLATVASGSILLWDVAKEEVLKSVGTPGAVRSMSWSADGRLAAVAGPGDAYVWSPPKRK